MAGWFSKARRALSRLVSGQPRAAPGEDLPGPRPITPSVPFERSWPEKITAGWLASTDPDVMLSNLPDDASPRKLLLFAVGCCRPLVGMIDHQDWCRLGVELAERGADDPVSEAAVRDILRAVEVVTEELVDEDDENLEVTADALVAQAIQRLLMARDRAVAQTARDAAGAIANLAAVAQGLSSPAIDATYRRERRRQCRLLRDVFGMPFLPLRLDPLWLACNDGAAVELARCIYESGQFADLPILADALEEAGCDNQEILWHCREIKDHVRGCWVVDAILGKK